MDGMIVDRRALGEMVRETSVSAHLFCKYAVLGQEAPHVTRKHYLSTLHQGYKTSMSTSAFYEGLFH